jgi:hypothetical protein
LTKRLNVVFLPEESLGSEFLDCHGRTNTLAPQPVPEDLELEKNAEAVFQVADELYMNRRYHLDP